MKVKDVIISALNILGRTDIVESLSSGALQQGEQTETVNTLLYCFNAVEDELARKYKPLSTSESLTASDGIYYFAAFAHTPVEIKRVTADGTDAEYTLTPQYISVNAKKITVEYSYAPSKKKLEGTSDFGDETGEFLLALGMAAEYCLINGEIEAAELWESRYRARISGEQIKVTYASGYIPPRRWA